MDLSAIDADIAAPGQQDLVWIGNAAFSAAGQLRYEVSGADNPLPCP
jgi:hypothetical protein